MNLREAKKEDLNEIYMMGYDVWGEGNSQSTYLEECKSSSKYAKGKWYVLEDEEVLVSSLILYDLTHLNLDSSLEIRGIGSIATHLNLRQKGYASNLIEMTINYINKNIFIDLWFLYSDIGVDLYNKLNFQALPNKFQNYPSTTLMLYSKSKVWNKDLNTSNIIIPDYF